MATKKNNPNNPSQPEFGQGRVELSLDEPGQSKSGRQNKFRMGFVARRRPTRPLDAPPPAKWAKAGKPRGKAVHSHAARDPYVWRQRVLLTLLVIVAAAGSFYAYKRYPAPFHRAWSAAEELLERAKDRLETESVHTVMSNQSVPVPVEKKQFDCALTLEGGTNVASQPNLAMRDRIMIAECFMYNNDPTNAALAIGPVAARVLRLPEAKLRGNSSVDVLFLYTRSLIDQGQSQRAEQILADRCRNWSLSTSCVAKLTILVDRELYNAAGEGWRRMQSSNVRLDGHTEARFWLAGAKIAIAQTQTEVGFERFETALKTAAEVPFPSLRRETYESYAMAIYGVQDWNMLRKVVGRALTEFQAQPKQPLLKLATLRDLGTGSNARQALTNVLEGTDLITRLVGDVDFLDILGVEALRLGLEDSLVRVLKRSQRQDSVRALWNRRLEQWQVRALLASRRFDDALVMLNQTQGLADDPVTLHLRGVAYLSLATDSRYYLLAAEQFQLALKQKLNWESLCALGFALARAGKMDQVPSIISQLEQTATKAMEIQWTRLLQSEYLALTGEPVAAMGILEKVIAVDPNSFVAHEQLVRRYQQIGDMQKKGIQELKYDELRRDLRYNETDEGMTAPIGPFAMASRLGVLKR